MKRRSFKFKEKENPFYRNYLFSEEDVQRAIFSRWNLLWLWIFPTHVQVSEGYAFHFKTTPSGQIWVMKIDKLDEIIDRGVEVNRQ